DLGGNARRGAREIDIGVLQDDCVHGGLRFDWATTDGGGLRDTTSATLVPPNPHENDRACSIRRSVSGRGPTWFSSQRGSTSSRWALAGSSDSCIATTVASSSSALVAPIRWPCTDLVDDTAARSGPAPKTSRSEVASITSPPPVAVAWALM